MGVEVAWVVGRWGVNLCMFICMFAQRGKIMNDMVHGPREIRDEDLTDSAPRVRALIVQRLEQVWRAVEPHVTADPDVRPDVRFIEAGIRCLDRLMVVYRLKEPVPADPGANTTELSVREQVLLELQATEERMRGD